MWELVSKYTSAGPWIGSEAPHDISTSLLREGEARSVVSTDLGRYTKICVLFHIDVLCLFPYSSLRYMKYLKCPGVKFCIGPLAEGNQMFSRCPFVLSETFLVQFWLIDLLSKLFLFHIIKMTSVHVSTLTWE